MALDVEQQLAVLLGGFPTRGGDVHQPEAAQLLDEILTLRRKEHKVYFDILAIITSRPLPGGLLLGFHDLLGRLGEVLLVLHEAFDLAYGVLVPGYLNTFRTSSPF